MKPVLSRGPEVLNFRTLEVTPDERQSMLLAQHLAFESFGPRAAQTDQDGRFPAENFADLQKHGFLDLRIPQSFGGKGASSTAFAVITFHLAEGDPATALCFAMHSTVMTMLEQLATREQQERYFADVVKGGKKFGAFVHEPDWNLFSGDLPATTLTEVSGGYLLKGRKTWCAFGEHADTMFVSALLGGDVLGVLVPSGTRGVSVKQPWHALAVRGSHSDVIDFDDVFVEESAVIRLPLNLLFELEYELGISACSLGIAETAYRYARGLASARAQRIVQSEVGHGHPDAARLFSAAGDARLTLTQAWNAVLAAALSGPVGSFERGLALVGAKHAAVTVSQEVARRAMELSGREGLRTDLPIERLFRDVQAVQHFGISGSDASYLAGRFELGVAQRGIIMDPTQMRA